MADRERMDAMKRPAETEGDAEKELCRATHAVLMALECVPRKHRKTRARYSTIERYLRAARQRLRRVGFE